MAKPSSLRYSTANWPDYNAALRRRGLLSIWFDPTMAWHAAQTGKRGHPETFSESAIQTCLTLKVLFGLPLRQTVGLVASLIEMAGLDWPAPDYSTLCRRQARLVVQIPYRRPGGPVTLPVDSTSIKFRGDGEWQARKHGASRRRQWRKVHIGMDAQTGDVRAVELTSSRQGDSRCCQTCWRSSPKMKRSARSRPTVPVTPDDTMARSSNGGPKRVYPFGGTVAPGKRTARPPASATTSCMRRCA